MRYMRAGLDQGISGEEVRYRLSCSSEEATDALEALQEQGYVTPATIAGQWRTTILGNALGNARFSPPVSRQVAERHLAELVARVGAVNEDPELCFWVNRLVLFGSLLDQSADKVGDVDVSVELGAREPDADPNELAERRAAATNRSFSTYVEFLAWPQKEVMMRLKARSRVLSLCEGPDMILAQVPAMVVFQRK